MAKIKGNVNGISVCNPDDIDREYLLKTVDYAVKNGINHFQFIGPIHNAVKGNIDGITPLKKYGEFNAEKDLEYLNYNVKVINEALEILSKNGVKSYMWHHELELPLGLEKKHPEILNENGDIEVSHFIVKDFLENKIKDFFATYPKMDGIILTLHETRIPLLKLQNQKLGKIERVKFVTKTLYDTCVELKKELIVRPFASVPQDYQDMLNAYESISKDLVVMDKWTQFDWSLTLPNNVFFEKIKNNPLLVETDIFGEYFGKGRLPLMLKRHLTEKFEYSERFNPIGYCNRIDRENRRPFNEVNEVNLYIANALMKGENVDSVIDDYFNKTYGKAGKVVRSLMEKTEELNEKLLYLKGYYFMQGSYFPQLNHSKNHFYFELMKDNYQIASNEWFIPLNYTRGEISELFKEKDEVVAESERLLNKLKSLESEIEKDKYAKLFIAFNNLYYSARVWRALLDVLYCYVKFFEYNDDSFEKKFYDGLSLMSKIDEEGRKVVGDSDDYYLNKYGFVNKGISHAIPLFIEEIKKSFEIEKQEYNSLSKESLTDFVIAGGAMESHKLQKEVNFSDTVIVNGKSGRIAGNMQGGSWSRVNAHGWFSYELKVTPNAENVLSFEFASMGDGLDVKITVKDKVYEIKKEISGTEIINIPYTAGKGESAVRVRIDRISKNTPVLHTVTVKGNCS